MIIVIKEDMSTPDFTPLIRDIIIKEAMGAKDRIFNM
jgi:hypothetical protein